MDTTCRQHALQGVKNFSVFNGKHGFQKAPLPLDQNAKANQGSYLYLLHIIKDLFLALRQRCSFPPLSKYCEVVRKHKMAFNSWRTFQNLKKASSSSQHKSHFKILSGFNFF